MFVERDNEEMPTSLKRISQPDKPLKVGWVPENLYDEMNDRYQELLSLGNTLMGLVEEQAEIISQLEQRHQDQKDESNLFYKPTDYEPGKLKMNLRSSGIEIVKPAKKKKFSGATVEFDPFQKKFGIGLHFTEVDR